MKKLQEFHLYDTSKSYKNYRFAGKDFYHRCIREIGDDYGLTKYTVGFCINRFIEKLVDEIIETGEVRIRGFGCFKLVKKRRNVFDKQDKLILSIKFVPSEKLKKHLKERLGDVDL